MKDLLLEFTTDKGLKVQVIQDHSNYDGYGLDSSYNVWVDQGNRDGSVGYTGDTEVDILDMGKEVA